MRLHIPLWTTGATHPALRLTVAVWLAFGLACGVRTAVSPVRHTVFPIFAGSATHWWNDQPLYERYPPLDYFRYPPVFAVGVTPLSVLGLTAGGILWGWLNLAVYGAGLWRFRRDVLPGEWTPPREAAFLLLALFGALRGLWNGQSNALAVGLLLLAAAALARRRWWRAAAMLAAPVLIKLTPLVPALLLCALWPRKLAGRFALFLALGLLLPFLTKAPSPVLDQYRSWLGHLLGSSGERWPGFRDGWTVWLVLRHVLAEDVLYLQEPIAHPALYRALQLLTAAGVLAWCLWQRARGVQTARLVALTLAMGMAWLMLFGPSVEHATFVFLAPLLAWALLEPQGSRVRCVLLGASSCLVLFLGWDALSRTWPEAQPFVLAALPAGTVLFAAWLLLHAAALPRPPQAAAPPEAGGARFAHEALRHAA